MGKQAIGQNLVTIVLLATFVGGASTHADDGELRLEAQRSAVEKSLPYVATQGQKWMRGEVDIQKDKACVSCHYVAFGIWAQTAAANAEIPLPDSSKLDELIDNAVSFVNKPDKGRPVTFSHLVIAMGDHSVSKGSSKTMNQWLEPLIVYQKDKGYWEALGQFPDQNREVMESNAVATMWAILALSKMKGTKAADAREKAISWLKDSRPGDSSEWWSWQLVVQSELANSTAKAKALEELKRRQNKDGGWSWIHGERSDAYSTGQVIYALSVSGYDLNQELVQRGIDYLVDNQQANGTWSVDSELVSAEPSKSKDHVYEYWGTTWATIALSSVIARQQPSAALETP